MQDGGHEVRRPAARRSRPAVAGHLPVRLQPERAHPPGYPQPHTPDARQIVDVSALAGDIDAGLVEAKLSGWFGGRTSDPDKAEASATCLDADGDSVGSQWWVGGVSPSARNNETKMLYREKKQVLLPGTRKLYIDVRVIYSGPSPDGYADELSLVLRKLPEVARVAVELDGGGGTVMLDGKQKREGDFLVGSEIDVVVVPNDGWAIKSWSGVDSEDGPFDMPNDPLPLKAEASLLVVNDMTVMVEMQRCYQLTLKVLGKGDPNDDYVVIDPNALAVLDPLFGLEPFTPTPRVYWPGEETFWVTSPVTLRSIPGWGKCTTKWTGVDPNSVTSEDRCGTRVDRATVKLTQPSQTVVAEIGRIPSYTLTVEVEGEGGKVRCLPEGPVNLTPWATHHEVVIMEGCKVDIEALPDSGWRVFQFKGPGLIDTSDNRVRAVVVDKNKQVTVSFVRKSGIDDLLPDPNATTSDPDDDARKTPGGCPASAAAAGSYLEADLAVLRSFRDEILMASAPGRWFVREYYAHSPPIASAIAEHDSLRIATRTALTPIVYGLKYPELVLLAGWTGVIMRPRRRRRLRSERR